MHSSIFIDTVFETECEEKGVLTFHKRTWLRCLVLDMNLGKIFWRFKDSDGLYRGKQ